MAKKAPVLIEWVDSAGITPGWECADALEPLKPPRCQSVGFLLEETAEYKTLVMTRSDSQILGRLTIPAQAILSVRKLR